MLCHHCGCQQGTETVLDRNYTHNGIKMWEKAGVYEALYESDGHKASEYVQVLEQGLRTFCENFADFEKLDSPNGWGLARHAIGFLCEVYFAFRTYPDATIHVSR